LYSTNSNIDTVNHAFRSLPDSVYSYFNVELITYDLLGCSASFLSPDSIVVTKSPKIDFAQRSTNKQCVPFMITLEERSNDVIRRNWIIDTLTSFRDSINTVLIKEFGDFKSTLVIENKFGCTDSMTFTIVANESPIVEFTSDDTLCRNKEVFLQGEVKSTNPIDYVNWNFGEPSNPMNTLDSNLIGRFMYSSRGLKNVVFSASLSNGCQDSIARTVIITDERDIEQMQINYVSFDENNNLEISFQPSAYNKFSFYAWRKSGLDWVKIPDQTNTNLLDEFLIIPYDSLCYDVAISDFCDFVGVPSIPHCFIYLEVESPEDYTNTLTWTPYVGWPNVQLYSIFRSSEKLPYQQIGEVSGDVLTYTDSNLCDLPYTYYVRANHPNDSLTSNSIRVTKNPLYTYNNSFSSIKNVSVVADNQIEVKWNKSQFSYFKSYEVTKFNDLETDILNIFELTDTSFIDTAVETSSNSYVYRVKEKDKCDNLNTDNRQGKSILLKGYYANESVSINESRLWWTRYVNWKNGVEDYQVQLFDVQETRILAKLGQPDTSYIDPEYHPEITEYYYYNVFATNNEGDTSYSNVVCLKGKERVELPTAFSPNRDGLNDEFKPITQFVKQTELKDISAYHFQVFNRWGEKLFETEDIKKGWNGYFMGSVCQQVVYSYIISVKNLDNQLATYSGSVTLLW
jgi:gliding motility-associated-like protein